MGNLGSFLRFDIEGSDEVSFVKKDQARGAFINQNAEESMRVHDSMTLSATEDHNREGGEYIKSIIYGGMDGIITTFAVVAGAAGADLGASVVLIMGFSNLIADGLSMGVGDFLSSTAENKYVASELAREKWEFENYPEGEKNEMIDLYESKGFSNADATRLVEILSQNKDYFIDTMLVEELGLMPPDPEHSPAKHGVVTFLSFMVNGLVPLVTFMIAAIVSSATRQPINFMFLFWITCALTVMTMFGLGVVSSIFSIHPWWKAGLFTTANGIVASAASYFIGWLVGLALGAVH